MCSRYSRVLGWVVLCAALLVDHPAEGNGQNGASLIPGRNVNMVSGTTLPGGDPHLQRQEEPSGDASTRNPMHLLAGSNDYSLTDNPGQLTDGHTGDSWQRFYKSFDGGRTWQSVLLPGWPDDLSPEGLASPIRGRQAASDPTVRASHNGLFYYSGIAFDRDPNGLGDIFVARFIDLNNAEGVSFVRISGYTPPAGATGSSPLKEDPIKYIDTQIIDSGTSGQFIDKPWLATDVPMVKGATMSQLPPIQDANSPSGFTSPGQFLCGNTYLSYAIFTGETSKNVRSKIMFARSTDCGQTWDKPIMIDESYRIGQGTTIGIDRSNPGTLYVAWRLFATTNEPDAIMVAKSTNYGAKFSKAVQVAAINPFEQPSISPPDFPARGFRTEAFPTMAVDDNGRAHIAWQQKSSDGYGRIVVSTSSDGGSTWATTPTVVEPTSLGHQIMPALTYAGGKLTLLFYDFREDLRKNTGLIVDPTPDDDYGWQPPFVYADGELLNSSGVPRYLPSSRHTMDVRVAQAVPSSSPAFSPSAKVSQYFSVIADVKVNPNYDINNRNSAKYVGVYVPLQFNPPNYPLFAQGTKAFIGDYIDIIGAPRMVYRSGRWQFNSDPVSFHSFWTDNRDVIPAHFDWTRYVAPGTPGCTQDTAGMRNQNIYTSQLTEGMVVGTMGNSKPLNSSTYRSFVIFVQNMTGKARDYSLSLTPAAGVSATFDEKASTSTLPVNGVLPRQGFTRTVFAKCSTTCTTDSIRSVVVTVQDTTPSIGGLTRSLTLNPDPTNPPLLIELEDHKPIFEKVETLTWPPLLDASGNINPALLDPNSADFKAEFLKAENLNPDMLAPDMLAPDMIAPDMIAPDMIAPDMIAPDMIAPDMIAPDMIAPDMIAPDMIAPDMIAVPITDITWTMTNGGNVDSGFKFAPIANLPPDAKKQLFIYRIYKTPRAASCDLSGNGFVEEGTHLDVIANVVNPDMIAPDMIAPDMIASSIENALKTIKPSTFKAGDDEKIYIKLRVWRPNPDRTQPYELPSVDPGAVGAVVVSQATAAGNIQLDLTPLVRKQPVSQEVCAGATASFSSDAIGSPLPTVQWQVSTDGGKNWMNVAGATSTTLSFTAEAGMNGYFYRAVFTSPSASGSANSAAAVLTVNTAPAVTTQPVSVTTCQSGTVQFAAAAQGSPAPSVQWQVFRVGGTNWENIIGAASTVLTVAADASVDGYKYRAAFTNTCAVAYSAAATLTVNAPPVVTTQPVDQTAMVGETATFTAAASGKPVPSVQWQVNAGTGWMDIVGATSTSYSVTAGLSISGYKYRAVFTNGCDSATSNAATLTVRYNFIGFASPLGPAGDPAPSLVYGPFNVQSNVTIKWQLKDGGGNYISDLGTVKSMKAAGASHTVTLYDPSSNTTGSTVLRYDAGNQQFVFNWDITQTPPDTYTLTLELKDGAKWSVKVWTQ